MQPIPKLLKGNAVPMLIAGAVVDNRLDAFGLRVVFADVRKLLHPHVCDGEGQARAAARHEQRREPLDAGIATVIIGAEDHMAAECVVSVPHGPDAHARMAPRLSDPQTVALCARETSDGILAMIAGPVQHSDGGTVDVRSVWHPVIWSTARAP